MHRMLTPHRLWTVIPMIFFCGLCLASGGLEQQTRYILLVCCDNLCMLLPLVCIRIRSLWHKIAALLHRKVAEFQFYRRFLHFEPPSQGFKPPLLVFVPVNSDVMTNETHTCAMSTCLQSERFNWSLQHPYQCLASIGRRYTAVASHPKDTCFHEHMGWF